MFFLFFFVFFVFFAGITEDDLKWLQATQDSSSTLRAMKRGAAAFRKFLGDNSEFELILLLIFQGGSTF